MRILVKLLPDSQRYLEADDGGGNRVSEEQIKKYLAIVLRGAAHDDPKHPPPPYPNWGVPEGWGKYLASESHHPGWGLRKYT